MTDSRDDILQLLIEIRNLLEPISACFKDQFAEIQRQELGARFEEFEALLTSKRRRIFPLLFDPRRLSQVEIAEEAGTTQPTVSRFISELLEHGLVEQTKDETGATAYEDKFGLTSLMGVRNERD